MSGCLRKFALRKICTECLRGIEAGNMRTDQFIGGVSLDRFGAGIRAYDSTTGVEHQQFVVTNAVDENAQLAVVFCVERRLYVESVFTHLSGLRSAALAVRPAQKCFERRAIGGLCQMRI